jgi:membrane associated rhomboid family serine protease
VIWLMPWDEDHPSRHHPWATWALLVANTLVFVALVAGGDGGDYAAVIDRYGLVAAEPRWFQYLTANFLHGDLLHLLGNLLFLYVLGDNVEDALGPGGLLLLYFGGGLLGDLLFVSANAALPIPTVGASGCISALAGAYAAMFFRQRVGLRVMLLVVPIYTLHLQAIWVLLLCFGLDVYLTFESRGAIAAAGGINFVAHGVGFCVGLGLGGFARLNGVLRRFATLASGDPWFGYWPSRLEDRGRVRFPRRKG